jgi:putative peptide zinc metalloprotease protein
VTTRLAVAGGPAPSAPLPPLREEIALHPGPVALDGSPSWTLHDPARNQFYRLGWREFEILSRWDCGDTASLIERLHEETTLEVEPEDVQDVARFLFSHSLVVSRSAEGTRRNR